MTRGRLFNRKGEAIDTLDSLIDLRRLYYFSKVAQYGSYREAAARESIAQSALTRQVQQLERDLGISLLSRGKTGATPT
ncbi:hypothetical protein BH09PSE6_BH09PSE6_08770 [soil metagenome]